MNAIDAIRASLKAYPEDRLDRETARALLDRLGRAEARIKAVEDLCDDADKRHASVLIVTTVRRAMEG